MLSPKESGEYISQLSEMVKIQDVRVNYLSEKIFDALNNGSISITGFLQYECHPNTKKFTAEEAVNWIFVIDTLNFCFWLPKKYGHWQITDKGKTYSGYFGLCVAIKRAIEGGIDLTNPKVYSTLTLKQLEQILQGDDPMIKLPLMKERLDSLHQVGNALIEKFEGSFLNCVLTSDKSAKKLLDTIVSEFICFRDESEYKGKKVSFYKRAQILVSDVWACFEGKGIGEFHDINTITMFADYRVPQVLVHFGVLKYSEKLSEKLNSEEVLENSCDEELEIRGCSIEAVERVNNRVHQLLRERKSKVLCNSILIDNYLWEYRRNHQNDLEHIPFHRVVSIYY